jgi:muconate cycloisomerase
MHTDAGLSGVGEAVPMHTYAEETQESIIGAIDRYLAPALIGADVSNFAMLHQKMDEALSGNTFAKAALDMAAYDVTGKILEVPVHQLLGGAYRDRIPLSMSIGIMSLERTVTRAHEIIDEGYKVVKLKVSLDYDDDVRKVAAVRKALGEDAWIRVDANAGYPSVQTAIHELQRMDEYGLYLIEQPLKRLELLGMAQVCTALRAPVLADESVYTPLDAMNVIRLQAADAINVKTQEAGGLYEAVKIAAIADAAGVPLLVGSQLESGVGNTANAHLAATLKYILHPADIKTPHQFVDDILAEPAKIEGGYTYVPQKPGLGIELDEEKLKKWHSKNK